jgi:hypothetical protein
MRDDAHLLGVGDHDPLHVRTDHGRNSRGVAGRLNNHNVVLGQRRGKCREPIASHVHATEPFELTVVPDHRLGKHAVDVQSDDAHACSPRPWLVRNGSWRATRHLLIRARSASG